MAVWTPILLESLDLPNLKRKSAEKLSSEILTMDPEIRIKKCLITTTSNSEQFLDVLSSRNNSFSKMIRIMVYKLRFTHFASRYLKMNKTLKPMAYRLTLLYDKIKKYSGYPRKSLRLGEKRVENKLIEKDGTFISKEIVILEEYNNALYTLIYFQQRKFFSAKISMLENHEELPITNKLRQLQIFLDGNDLIRIGGRLENSELDYEQKYPLLLEKECRLTTLLAMEIHQKLLCCGLNQVLNEMRKMYWTLSMRQMIKKVLHKCVKCRIRKPAYIYEKMPPLPHERWVSTKPFEKTFIDLFGHFFRKG